MVAFGSPDEPYRIDAHVGCKGITTYTLRHDDHPNIQNFEIDADDIDTLNIAGYGPMKMPDLYARLKADYIDSPIIKDVPKLHYDFDDEKNGVFKRTNEFMERLFQNAGDIYLHKENNYELEHIARYNHKEVVMHCERRNHGRVTFTSKGLITYEDETQMVYGRGKIEKVKLRSMTAKSFSAKIGDKEFSCYQEFYDYIDKFATLPPKRFS